MRILQPLHRRLANLFCLAVAWYCFLPSLNGQEQPAPGFEILSHNASIQIYPQQNTIVCVDTISIRRLVEKETKVSLSLFHIFEINYLLFNGKQRDFKRGDDFILVENLPLDSVMELVVSYSGELSFRSELCRITADHAVLREEIILPHTNEYLTSTRLSVTVPKDWEATTVGKLAARIAVNDSTTFVWESNDINKEIGWICAGIYKTRQSADGSHLSIHLFRDDSTTAADDILSLVKRVLGFYSAKFTPYRYPKLDIVEVDDWVAGKNVLAVAAPSFIMVKKIAFETHDKFIQASSILPHEIAHQWWPLTVFIGDEDVALLAEGMCEYSARLYDEGNHIMSIRDSLDYHPLLRPLILKVIQGEDIPLHQKTDLRAAVTLYLKAMYVHNMLRAYIGDSVFSRLYHEYAVRFGLKITTSDDFRLLAEELSGKKLGWFFDQWVAKKGVPHLKIYNAHRKLDSAGWVTRGRVRLVGYDRFSTFVDVGVKTEAGVTTCRVWLGASNTESGVDSAAAGEYRNDVPFEIRTSGKPLRAILDPNGDVLKMKKIPPRLSDLRDPGEGVMIIGTKEHADYLSKLARFDSSAMDGSGWTLSIKCDTEATLKDFQQNHVFLYGTAAENSKVAEMLDKFPLQFRNDSVVVNKEAIYDTSLTLVQMIDNPFQNNGSLCWIAPLSDKAKPELLPYDASWLLLRGKEEISSGTWDVNDEDLSVEIKN
ncbi:MAG: M1 family aminopeptidase [Bacteroidota bacterium]